MGHVFAEVVIHGKAKSVRVKKALIDTGADRTVVSGDVARRAGLRSDMTDVLSTPKGPFEVPIALAKIEIGKATIVTSVGIMGRMADKVVIGHDVLESLPADVEVKGERLVITRIREGLRA